MHLGILLSIIMMMYYVRRTYGGLSPISCRVGGYTASLYSNIIVRVTFNLDHRTGYHLELNRGFSTPGLGHFDCSRIRVNGTIKVTCNTGLVLCGGLQCGIMMEYIDGQIRSGGTDEITIPGFDFLIPPLDPDLHSTAVYSAYQGTITTGKYKFCYTSPLLYSFISNAIYGNLY